MAEHDSFWARKAGNQRKYHYFEYCDRRWRDGYVSACSRYVYYEGDTEILIVRADPVTLDNSRKCQQCLGKIYSRVDSNE